MSRGKVSLALLSVQSLCKEEADLGPAPSGFAAALGAQVALQHCPILPRGAGDSTDIQKGVKREPANDSNVRIHEQTKAALALFEPKGTFLNWQKRGHFYFGLTIFALMVDLLLSSCLFIPLLQPEIIDPYIVGD